MANSPRKTYLFTALTIVWLALAVVFTGIFVIEKYNHDCAGEGCHICLEIQTAQRLIEAFVRLGASMAVTVFILCVGPIINTALLFRIKIPIELKVRFNC